ncbi:Delta(8)-fatty-acid desaturase [Cyphellophora attinorum]|uniref:Delta 8-(E)-sphingolipid desaturase n=1 Tax=Cyphellophora attinorum TaxID=1664694 RepID=A0A0N1P1H3_9EURO|nr:Delta(8)-fatty-acid desaturase [Phialophora attinorum]KPI44386.1 Delta(8)-fatty-acid desaturase [Phialophora attinorum]
MAAKRAHKERIWTRREIEGLIAEGRKIIILQCQVVKVDAWIPFHPGGEKTILHMVGRDSTDEVLALHSPEAVTMMQKYVIGRIEGRWENFVPPIQGGVFRNIAEAEEECEREESVQPEASESSDSSAPSPVFDSVEGIARRRFATETSSISSGPSELDLPEPATEQIQTPKAQPAFICSNPSNELLNYPSLSPASQDAICTKYRELDAKMRAEGMYQCNYSAYAWEMSRCLALFLAFLYCLHISQYALAGVFLGLFRHQLVFTAHDAGHNGITHNLHIDTCIGIFIANICGGLSIGWWKRSHYVHHIVTNSPEHDPDIEHMPVFAISTKFFNNLYSTYHNKTMVFDAAARWFIARQHYLYYPILSLAHFNLYAQSYIYLFSAQPPKRGPAWSTGTSNSSASQSTGTVLVSHIVCSPLHIQITLSHFAMSTADLGVHESFPQKMLRTTMDVDCPPWLDFVHGGLQFQAVHHLYPRMPRHNLRKAQKYVKEFCAEVGIPYVIYGFGRGNAEVLGRLGEVARQVKYLEECQKVAARDLFEGEGHHVQRQSKI